METSPAAVVHDLSLYSMFLGADPIVKGVMILLALSSVICWAIILEKTYRLFVLKRDLANMDRIARTPAEAASVSGLTRTLLSAAEGEATDGASRGESRSDIRARLEKAMRTSLKTELQKIEIGLPFLATIGSAAPFIGLFGTVWGIMNSFTAIAHQQDTSLATVAPGIAEALFATALGLAAAIPAVMFYNHFAVKLGRASSSAASAIAELAKHISRSGQDQGTKGSVEPIRAAGKSH